MEPLLGGGIRPGIELIEADRIHEVLDLGAGRGHLGRVRMLQHRHRHQAREQRDDGHHHQHLDEGDACLCSSSAISLVHDYTATSLMLVIASSMLNIRAPTITPITRMTIGSKIAVKRLMAARVSFS